MFTWEQILQAIINLNEHARLQQGFNKGIVERINKDKDETIQAFQEIIKIHNEDGRILVEYKNHIEHLYKRLEVMETLLGKEFRKEVEKPVIAGQRKYGTA